MAALRKRDAMKKDVSPKDARRDGRLHSSGSLFLIGEFQFVEMTYEVGEKIWDCDVIFTNCAGSSLGAI